METKSGRVFLAVFRLPACRHRASIRNVILLFHAHGLPAEVPAGSRTFVVNSAAPWCFSAAIRLLFLQVPAGSIRKKITIAFLKAPVAEVAQVVRFAFLDGYEREPAAALATTAAGAGDRRALRCVHAYTRGIAIRVRITDNRRVSGSVFKDQSDNGILEKNGIWIPARYRRDGRLMLKELISSRILYNGISVKISFFVSGTRFPSRLPAHGYRPSYILPEHNTVSRRSGPSRRNHGRWPAVSRRWRSPTS